MMNFRDFFGVRIRGREDLWFSISAWTSTMHAQYDVSVAGGWLSIVAALRPGQGAWRPSSGSLVSHRNRMSTDTARWSRSLFMAADGYPRLMEPVKVALKWNNCMYVDRVGYSLPDGENPAVVYVGSSVTDRWLVGTRGVLRAGQDHRPVRVAVTAWSPDL